MKNDYIVVTEIVSMYGAQITANSPEEAEDIAERHFEETGEPLGDHLDTDLLGITADEDREGDQ